MPNEKQHIQWAIHNIDALKYLLKKPEFCDWAATVGFYVCLHIIDGVLFIHEKKQNSKHGHDHHQRQNILKKTKEYQPIYKLYRILRTVSNVARYLENRGKPVFFQQYMSADNVRNKLIGKDLKEIMLLAIPFLSDESKKSLQEILQHFP